MTWADADRRSYSTRICLQMVSIKWSQSLAWRMRRQLLDPVGAYSVADVVRRATAIVDPKGEDPAVVELADQFGDDDEPVRGVLESLEERLAWGADEDPPIVMAQAVVLYVAHRPDELDDDPEDLLRLAARAEFDGKPPERVTAWLEERGVELA